MPDDAIKIVITKQVGRPMLASEDNTPVFRLQIIRFLYQAASLFSRILGREYEHNSLYGRGFNGVMRGTFWFYGSEIEKIRLFFSELSSLTEIPFVYVIRDSHVREEVADYVARRVLGIEELISSEIPESSNPMTYALSVWLGVDSQCVSTDHDHEKGYLNVYYSGHTTPFHEEHMYRRLSTYDLMDFIEWFMMSTSLFSVRDLFRRRSTEQQGDQEPPMTYWSPGPQRQSNQGRSIIDSLSVEEVERRRDIIDDHTRFFLSHPIITSHIWDSIYTERPETTHPPDAPSPSPSMHFNLNLNPTEAEVMGL
jgi:hypothetical protein